MHCPALEELPAPPPDKTGWPWTIASTPLPALMPDGNPWPKISIVTPSFNQGEYIEETIRSVLLQGYPNLEYLIMDGGSSDQSLNLIQKYAKWIAHWVSKPDAGQSSAINEGFLQATGVWANWLNSDDILLPNTLVKIAQTIDERTTLVCGRAEYRDAELKVIVYRCETNVVDRGNLFSYFDGIFVSQPSCFFSLDKFREVGCLDKNLHYCMDLDLWFRFAEMSGLRSVDTVLSVMRLHDKAKTPNGCLDLVDEVELVFSRYAGNLKKSHPISYANLRNERARRKVQVAIADLKKRKFQSALLHYFSAFRYSWVMPFVSLPLKNLLRKVLFGRK